MASVKFVKHPNFPKANCHLTAGGYFWKMQVREWAFAQVDVENLPAGARGTSQTPAVVPGHGHPTQSGKVLTTTASAGNKGTIRFYADAPGFAFVYVFGADLFSPIDKVLMQVQVLNRRAASAKDISLTKLSGSTFGINAPDAKSYTMDKTVVFSGAAVNPLSFFAGVPKGTNHVVISSHGGVPTAADKTDAKKICMFVAGFKLEALRLDTGNVEATFATLKGQVSDNCVVWFGGCNIGANTDFCGKAAKASGCYVVAPVMPLTAQSFPKNHVDILDGFAIPNVFKPDGKSLAVTDFCAFQDKLKFIVPV